MRLDTKGNPSQRTFLWLDAVRKLVRRGAYGNLEKVLQKLHPADIAQLLGQLTLAEKQAVFNLLKDPEFAARVLSETDPATGAELLEQLTSAEIAKILREMPSDDAADFLGRLPEEKAEELLRLLGEESSEEVEELLRYGEETAGGIMNPNFLALKGDLTAREAIAEIQKAGDVEMAFYLYVVDERGHLVGVVSLRQLILARPDSPLKALMITDVISVQVTQDQEEVAHLVARYNLLAIPVVDEENILVGIITVDDVIDVIRDEATEDIYKMAGADYEELATGRRDASRIVKLRLPWLLVSLAGGLAAGALLWLFRSDLEEVIALVVFIPVLLGTWRNVGSRAAAIMVRGLATGGIQLSQLGPFLWRELRIGALTGFICGGIVGVLALLWHRNPLLGVVVGVAMFAGVLVAAVAGTLIPALFRRVRMDPAVGSGPSVTIITDLAGLGIYLGLSTLLLRLLR